MRKHANDMLKWVKEVVAEDVDLVLEDVQNLSNWGNVEEKIDRGEQDFFKSALDNLATHVALSSPFHQTAELSYQDLEECIHRKFPHEGRVRSLLFLRVNECEFSVDPLNMVVKELLTLSVENEEKDRNWSTNESPELRISLSVWVHIFVSLVYQ